MEKFSLEFATAIAESAHEGQVDKNDVPYIFHPLGVMDMVQGEDAKTVALLHDVLEDSDLTPNDLRELGCPDHVLVAVELVTHGLDYDDTHEGYFRDIQRIADSKNQLAIDVKFADITHNSDQTRISNPTDRDFKRWGKYVIARDMLKPLVSDYLRDI